MPRHPHIAKRAMGLVALVVGWLLVATPAAAGVPDWTPGPPPDIPFFPPEGSQEGSFDALSYNVAGLTDPISGSEPATNSALISPLLNAYDLVLLQEDWEDHFDQQGLDRPDPVPASFYHHEIVSEVDHPYRSEPGHHPYGTDLRRLPTGPPLIADGLNRLSRSPFDEVERVMWRTCHGELTVTVVEEILKAAGLHEALEPLGVTGDEGLVDGGSADCGAQKGFSFARTELAPGVEVDVYNLHGDAGGHVNDVAAREDNFAQLADFINERSAGRAVVLGGDTNLQIDRDDPIRETDGQVWEDFQADTGLIDVCAAIDCGDDDAVIDKFAFRSGGGVEVTPTDHSFERERFTRDDGEPLSDHDPLVVTFDWAS